MSGSKRALQSTLEFVPVDESGVARRGRFGAFFEEMLLDDKSYD
jgi:hypothetical protein